MSPVGGLSDANLKNLRKIFREALKSKSSIKVFLFGSRARGDFQKYSDVDLLIDGAVDARQLRGLRNALADSELPFKCDVVPSREVYEHYRRQVESEKRFLFQMDAL